MRRTLVSILLLALSTYMFGQTLTGPANNATSQSAKVTFGWDKVTGSTPAGFEIAYTTTASGTDLPTGTTVPTGANLGTLGTATAVKGYVAYSGAYTTTSYTHNLNTANSVLFPINKQVYWKVRQKTGTTWGSWSAAFNFTTGTPTITAPSSAQNPGSVTIAWNSYGQTATKVYLAEDGTTYDAGTTAGSSGSTSITLPAGASRTGAKVKLGYGSPEAFVISSAFTINASTAFVTAPSSPAVPGDSVNVAWNSYGSTVNKMKFSVDGTNWTNAQDASTSPTKFLIPKGNGYDSCYVALFNDNTEVVRSSSFAVSQSAAEISTSASSYAPGEQAGSVIYSAYGRTITGIKFSADSGSTWGTAQVPSSSPFDFVFPAGSNRTRCVVGLFTSGGLVAQSEMFTVTGSSVTFMTVPSGTEAPGFHMVAWVNGGVPLEKIKMSTDNGSTWGGYSVTLSNGQSTADTVSYQFDLLGKTTDIAQCKIGLFESGDTIPVVASAAFALTKGGAYFKIPTSYTDPGATLLVPISIKNTLLKSGASGKIRAFDLKVAYNDKYMTIDMDGSAPLLTLKAKNGDVLTGAGGWSVMSAKTEKDADDYTSYIIISAYAPAAANAVPECVLTLSYSVDTTATHAGSSKELQILTVTAADEKALAIPHANITYTAAADVEILTSITGKIEYFFDGAATTYKLSGTEWMHYVDTSDVEGAAHVNSQVVSVGPAASRAVGVYKIVQVEAGNPVTYAPSYDLWPTSLLSDEEDQTSVDLTGVIDADDAQIAFGVTFDDPADPLYTTRQRIAADVNEDGVVNSIDALSIMDINNSGAWYINNPDLGLKKWSFFTTASVVAQDSNDYTTDDVRSSLESQFDETLAANEVFSGKDFLGVLRGDADFSFVGTSDKSLNKSNATPVLCNLPEVTQVRAGDTVYVPIDVQLDGKSMLTFSASVKVDKGMFSSFAGVVEGPAFPSNKGWHTVANYNAKSGLLTLATTDLAGTRDAITQEGTILILKFVVSKEAKRGSISSISMPKVSISDKDMNKLSSSSSMGKIEVTRLGSTVVSDYALSQNYPNPFNPSTTIEYALPKASSVKIEIFNMLGQSMGTLFSGTQSNGYHQVEWNASQLSSGVYLYTISATSLTDGQTFRSVKKMMLMK
ncbi:MAG: T9SS type A sorting domain-containing protein [Bacteroidota bacterium]